MNDTFYKNELQAFRVYVSSAYVSSIVAFSASAQDAYQLIREQTGDTSELPSFIPHNLIKPSEAQLALFIGEYELTSSDFPEAIGAIFILEKLENHISVSMVGMNEKEDLYFKSDSTLYDKFNTTISLGEESSDTLTILNIQGPFIRSTLVKVKNEGSEPELY